MARKNTRNEIVIRTIRVEEDIEQRFEELAREGGFENARELMEKVISEHGMIYEQPSTVGVDLRLQGGVLDKLDRASRSRDLALNQHMRQVLLNWLALRK